jgi:hypothetical protein
VDRDAAVTLEINAAEIAARLDRADRAMLRLERSRDSSCGAIDAGEIQSWLEREKAAFVWFSVTRRETLLVIAEPGRAPMARFAPLSERDLADLLPPRISDSEWNRNLTAALPALSRRLAPALDAVSRRVPVIYLCPDSQLFRVPFAALSFEDGSCLIDRCALVLAPAFAIARRCANRAGIARRLFAAGSGGTETMSFDSHADEIAALPGWPAAAVRRNVSLAEFLEGASQHGVVHLACHGIVESSVLEGMQASRLILRDGEMCSAKSLSTLSLDADLVFLNACTSGVYQAKLGSGTGGFWRAFLEAGAASLVATLSYVDPANAQSLALDFYRHWNTMAATKAEALRQAQLALKTTGHDTLDWSSHVLIGSHR